MDTYWPCYSPLAYLYQQPCESTYEYFERYKYYLDEDPNHGFQFHELVKHFLDGMLPDERYILDNMAGRRIMECTPSEVWYLIEERAENTRPYTEYSKLSHEEIACQLAAAERVLHQKRRNAAEAWRKMEEAEQAAREAEELYRRSQGQQVREEQYEDIVDEDTLEEELQVVAIMSAEDVLTEEGLSPQCSEIILEQDMVITTTPSIPLISNLLLPSPVQDGTIQKALRNNQVWGSLEKVTIHIPMVRNPMIIQKPEQFLDRLCINWKTRKKGMQGSPEKIDPHTHMARVRKRMQRLEKLLEGLCRTWKKRKKCKRVLVDEEGTMFPVHFQRSHSTFGWKPGWNAWSSISHKVTRKVRRGVRKFDGVHPWAPNIG